VRPRGIDDLQDLGRCRLLGQRFVALGITRGELAPEVSNGLLKIG
jgi:hypothetical protein